MGQDLQDMVKSVSLVGLPLKKTKQLRIWKLGNLENKIYPTEENFKKLEEILISKEFKNDHPYDIIWGPDLQLEIFDIEVDNSIDVINNGDKTNE